MNIKENIDSNVLKEVAQSVNVTEDLLIKMISTDLHNHMITVFSLVLIGFIVIIVLFTMVYFRSKNNKNNMFDDLCIVAGVLISLVLFLATLATYAYKNEFEILNNHEYAVVKEINKMHKELKDPPLKDGSEQ